MNKLTQEREDELVERYLAGDIGLDDVVLDGLLVEEEADE